MTHDPPNSREHDLVLWGATGFTGRLVAEHVLSRPETRGLRVALGGRSREKLQAVRRDLVAGVGAPESLPLVVADAGDPDAMGAVARSARVVCTTVGPFAKYGSTLVAACASEGTHYCDITGEVGWVRRMIDAHDDEARASGARIVSFAGFDSIPSDLGVFMLHDHLARTRGGHLVEARAVLTDLRGGVSGGTLASVVGVFEEIGRDRAAMRLAANPYALYPAGMPPGPREGGPKGVSYDEGLGVYTAPFIMAATNSRVVHWTNAQLGLPYGAGFTYSERQGFGGGVRGLARAAAATAQLAALGLGLSIAPTRHLLARHVFPRPGEGPSAEARAAGGFQAVLVGRGADGEGRSVPVRGRVVGHADPGYGETAKMVGQTALCLALDAARLPARAGLGSPAALLGTALIERLRGVGMEFEVEEG